MCNHHVCHIVPPHILEGLARRGNVNCKKTLNDSFRILHKRNTLLNNQLIKEFKEGNGDRYIYDSHGKFRQRYTLRRKEGEGVYVDHLVNEAYDTSGFVRDYFRSTFDLNSVNGKGLDLISNIHYGINYNNAFWDGDEMTYGDGDNVEFKNFAGAIDVVAHELMHGITQFTANLEYKGQSGALNEHFSDVFGTIIKQAYLKQNLDEADWFIGDTVVTDDFPGDAIRSMKAPGTANEFDIQPAHMNDYYSGDADNQGVHINSGIPNKAFYLCCMEIGINDCALIWFETLKMLWRTANFEDMLTLSLQIASQLSEEKKVCDTAYEAVGQSFAAVGIKQILI